ncbi:MAG: TRAP transporter small permease subunit [Proteobacteria bacterium]|nr:TRAP transporter small permease subunit [Pseudomonadota bacterium]
MSEIMGRLQELSERVSRVAVHVSGVLLILSAAAVAVEVIGRKAFNYSFTAVDEVSGYIFGITTAWALSFALFRRAHVRIDAVYVHLSQRSRCVMDVIAMTSLAVVFTLLAHQAYGVVHESLRLGAESNTPLRMPLWIPQILWMGGLWFFIANIYLVLVRSLMGLVCGDYDLVRAIAGAPSLHEEVEKEIHHVEKVRQREAPAAGEEDV